MKEHAKATQNTIKSGIQARGRPSAVQAEATNEDEGGRSVETSLPSLYKKELVKKKTWDRTL